MGEAAETSLTALIAVKGVSERLPGKNTLPFNGQTLLSHKIRQLANAQGISQVVVSSEDESLLEIATREGATARKRPEAFADESRPFSDFLLYVTSIVSSAHLMWAPVTSPLVKISTYEKAIGSYYTGLRQGFDSLISVLEMKEYVRDRHRPLNYQIGAERPGTQDLRPLYVCTNGLILCPVNKICEWQDHYGPNPVLFELNKLEALDIDTEEDYRIALALSNLI